MKETRKNFEPKAPSKTGPETAGLGKTELVEDMKFGGHKPNGEKHSSDTKGGHWSGH